jgi:hypothetical protein
VALPYLVDSLDAVPEPFRGEYAEFEGKFQLKVDGLDDNSGLISALRKERAARADLEKTMKAWVSIGSSPDDIKALIAERETEAAELRTAEREARTAAGITGALSKARATAEGLALLPTALADRVKIETIDGKRVVSILSADGKTPMVGATFDTLVRETVKSFPSLFEGTGGGTGASVRTMPSTSHTISRTQFDSLSPQEKSARVRDGWSIHD